MMCTTRAMHNPRDVHAAQTGLRKRAYGAHLNGLHKCCA